MSIFKNIFIIFRAMCELFRFIEFRLCSSTWWDFVKLGARVILAMCVDV